MAISGVRSCHLGLLAIGLVVFAWSAWHPVNYFIWFLEVVPAIVGALVLIAIYPRFKFTDLVYVLVLIHAIILMIGGHYTYAEMPSSTGCGTSFISPVITTTALATLRKGLFPR